MLACSFHTVDPDVDGPVTDVQLALLLQRFSAIPTFETEAFLFNFARSLADPVIAPIYLRRRYDTPRPIDEYHPYARTSNGITHGRENRP